MNSSRTRYKHITPKSPEEIMEISMQNGMDNVRRHTTKMRADEKIALGKCASCGKESGDAAKSCARCKAAKYCNQTCQLADFKPRHKHECANFVHPPITSAFLTKPVAYERYPMQPVFAAGHEESVGCWVSVEGRIDCDLEKLTSAFGNTKKYSDREKRVNGGPDKGRGTIRRYNATACSLLGLRVLVQNRRKDGQPILVFGSRMQVVSYPSMTTAMSRGRRIGESGGPFVNEGKTRLAGGIAKDPWDKVPRLEIAYVNGQEVKPSEAPLPSSIKVAAEGIVALKMGEFAIINAQFRVGDGDTIAKDWEALACLETLHIPYAIWDGSTAPTALVPLLPMADNNPPMGRANVPGRSLAARFDQAAVRSYYADFIQQGEEEYIRSHFRDEGVHSGGGAENLIKMMGQLMRGYAEEGILPEHLKPLANIGNPGAT